MLWLGGTVFEDDGDDEGGGEDPGIVEVGPDVGGGEMGEFGGEERLSTIGNETLDDARGGVEDAGGLARVDAEAGADVF